MAGYLPRAWYHKRVAVVLEGSINFEATLVSDSEGGVNVDMGEGQGARHLFIPWTAVQYVELLEGVDEARPTPSARPADGPRNIAP